MAAALVNSPTEQLAAERTAQIGLLRAMMRAG